VDTLYFDHNATTFIDPAVVQRMQSLYAQRLANASSQHHAGRAALKVLEQAKADLLQLIDAPAKGMDSAQVILTSGGTEANNLAIAGLCRPANDNVHQPALNLTKAIICGTEHPSVLEAAAEWLPHVKILPVDQFGRARLDILEEWLEIADADANRVGLVSVMLGNNETGVLQDLPAICLCCHRFGAVVHSDIVQAIGKIPFSMRESGVDAVTLTAHKLHGPIGVGALVVRHGLSVQPMLFGGGQQLAVRPGTEPVVLADAFASALRLTIEAQTRGDYERLAEARNSFESALLEQLPEIAVVSQNTPRLPHTSNIAFHGIDRQALLMALDMAGIACSTGSACASGSGRPSHVLQAMQLPKATVSSALRFSFSRMTTSDELKEGVSRVVRTVRKLRGT
jgi:cysteine desulfurase